MQSHTLQNPFICVVSHMKFAENGLLKAHMLIHPCNKV